MPKPVEVIDAADWESIEAIRWYKKKDGRLSEAFADEFEDAIRVVGAKYAVFPDYLYGTKRHLFGRYPYQLVFRELPDRIQVVALAHLRRKPGYWKRRLK
jgi:hypothetical protein